MFMCKKENLFLNINYFNFISKDDIQVLVARLPAASETQHCSFSPVIGLMRYGTSLILAERGGRAGKRPTPHI